MRLLILCLPVPCLCLALHPAVAQAPLPITPGLSAKAATLVEKMSLDEKLALIGGEDVFYTRAVPSIGLKRLKMSDGPVGVRTFGPSTSYAAGVALAASWDTSLAHRVGEALGDDARARGAHFLLAPGVNIYRSPLNGRNMEYFGEDPFLAGRMATEYILGVQSKGVAATVKHFAANDSEYDRHRINSVIDERTLRELHLPAFEMAVKEGHVAAVMDSYNLVNGAHATENKHLNLDILKSEWGFQGILMSDWDATYDAVAAANAGLDLEMPYAKLMSSSALKAALQSGQMSMSILDEKCLRIVRTALQFHWLDREQADVTIPLQSLQGDAVALDAARESVTLLKNENHLLPLDARKVKTIAVVGPIAISAVVGGGGSSQTVPFAAESFTAGLTRYLNGQVKVLYAPALPGVQDLASATHFENLTVAQKEKEVSAKADGPRKIAVIRAENLGGSKVAGHPGQPRKMFEYSGTYVAPASGKQLMVVGAQEVDGYRIVVDGKEVMNHPAGEAYRSGNLRYDSTTFVLPGTKKASFTLEYSTPAAAPRISVGILPVTEIVPVPSKQILRNADAVLLAVGFNAETEAEEFDRTYRLPGGQSELIDEVTALNPKTIVTLTAGGAVETAPWIAKAPALLHNFYPGQQGARALSEILFGERSPEGHLPFSWERTLAENPTSSHYYEETPSRDVHYAEGLLVGYRYYTTMNRPSLFAFGTGMSYTTFAYSNLEVKRIAPDDTVVSLTVANTGRTAGAAVPQIYVSEMAPKVSRPRRELKQFVKVRLASGQTEKVTLHLNRRAFEYWDETNKSWKLQPGTFEVEIGESAEAIVSRASVVLD